MKNLILSLLFVTDFLCEVYSKSVLASENSRTLSPVFRRDGVFLRLETLKPSLPPTLPQQTEADNIHGYKQLAVNTTLPINNNNTKTTHNKTAPKDTQTKLNKAVVQDNQPNLNKVNLVRPESFPKPTSIPPIGKLLEKSSPTSRIQPMASQLLRIKKPESFRPINEQFVAFDDVSIIEDMPKMPDMDSMENFFKNDIDKDLKRRNFIDIMPFKKNCKGFVSTEPTSTLKKLKNFNRRHCNFRTYVQSSKVPSFIKRRLWSPKTVISKNEIQMIVPYELPLNLRQIKSKVYKIILGKRHNKSTEKKVFIPPPPPIQLKKLEPFQKEKEIEHISKESIQIEQPEPLEGIDKHLQTIDKQAEIKPISEHLIKNEPFKAVENIDAIQPIEAMESN